VNNVKINAKWFAARSCDRVDDARFWNCTDIDLPLKAKKTEVLTDVVLPGYRDNRIQSVAASLVRLSFDIPYAVDNVYATSFSGVGLIVDAENGLLITDRNTVPVELGDLEITFFSTYKIPGEVVFLHPLHNIAILKYDPALLGDVEIETLPLADDFPELDSSLELIGYRNDGTIRKQKVSNLSEVSLYFDLPRLSRFQQVPVDVLSASLVGPTLGGPLLDANGVVLRQVVGDSNNPLVVGDMILQVDGEIPTTFFDFEQHVQNAVVPIKVMRDGQVIDLDVPMIHYKARGTDRALLWAGSLIQEPHFELGFQRGNTTKGVFISSTLGGSPSIQDRLYRNRYIVEVEGVAISSIDDFIEEVARKNPDQPVSLTVVAMNGYRSVVSVQPEYSFWPTLELVRGDSGWTLKTLSSEQVAVSE